RSRSGAGWHGGAPGLAAGRAGRSCRAMAGTPSRRCRPECAPDCRSSRPRAVVPLVGRGRWWQYHGVNSLARPAMKIDRIDHLNITVADIDRSVEFYQRVRGMKTERIGEGRAALLFGQRKIHLDLARATAMGGEERLSA